MSTLGTYLAREGFTVNDAPVPGRTSTWDRVRWIVVHHTVSSCDISDARRMAGYLKTASGRYPPLCQLFLDQSGAVWTISEQRPGQAEPGRASHMGKGSYPGIKTDRGNEVALGIECQCMGSHALATHPVMYRALIRLVASLCRRYGLGADRVIGHKEYNPGKIDPRDSMARIRADVAAELSTPPSPPPAPPAPPAPPVAPPLVTPEETMQLIQSPDGDWYALHAGTLVLLDEPTFRNAYSRKPFADAAFRATHDTWGRLVAAFGQAAETPLPQ